MPDRLTRMWRGLREFMESPTENSILRFAWALVAFIVIVLAALNWYVIDTLSDRSWCTQLTTVDRYLQGENGVRNASPENVQLILDSCRTIGLAQLEPLAWVAKALAVSLGLMGVSVFVVKFSGASLSGKFGGADVRLGSGDSALRQAAHNAADAVAGEAEKAAGLFPEPEMPAADEERP